MEFSEVTARRWLFRSAAVGVMFAFLTAGSVVSAGLASSVRDDPNVTLLRDGVPLAPTPGDLAWVAMVGIAGFVCTTVFMLLVVVAFLRSAWVTRKR